ncbi:hypothetical protein JCM9140_1142 [Halalkalibacter wakoensis JCM 9140]|uniref:Uncharacterized protein n=1 Tax=Halalkalibacter wakoensis JCM 9140 TaxID=1236970 RepID=W4Q1B4_9BACI|nr:hypothetical protein [Halalkalibacter wakoensis]GAE25164.1 hypothetical protein JCM9140_1142 [Halalkalibacter wakoensis JCM 9140]
MDKKDQLNNEDTKYRGGRYRTTDNHIPKNVRDQFFGDVLKQSRKNKRKGDSVILN